MRNGGPFFSDFLEKGSFTLAIANSSIGQDVVLTLRRGGVTRGEIELELIATLGEKP